MHPLSPSFCYLLSVLYSEQSAIKLDVKIRFKNGVLASGHKAPLSYMIYSTLFRSPVCEGRALLYFFAKPMGLKYISFLLSPRSARILFKYLKYYGQVPLFSLFSLFHKLNFDIELVMKQANFRDEKSHRKSAYVLPIPTTK